MEHGHKHRPCLLTSTWILYALHEVEVLCFREDSPRVSHIPQLLWQGKTALKSEHFRCNATSMEEYFPFHRIISEDDRLHGKTSSCTEGGNELSVDVTRAEPSASLRSWYTQS